MTWLRPLRRRLSQLFDPGPEPNEVFDWFISAPLRCAEALRKALRLDEQSFIGVAGQSHADARAYLIYTAIDEVQKASLWLIRMRELVQGEPVKPRDGAHERLLHTHLIEERDARTRRLLETMVTLVLFTQTNEQGHFRHLLALEILDEELSAQGDAREFWGAPTNNLRWSIEHQLTLVRACEAEVDMSHCWYLLERKPLPDPQHLRPAKLMSSARTRIREALPLMREREQMLFGFSYGASYARASESIHYAAERPANPVSDETDVTGYSHIGLLSFAILQRCQELMGGAAIPELDRVSELLSRRDKESPIGKSFFGQAEAGDIVLANGELGQVLETTPRCQDSCRMAGVTSAI